MFGVLDEWELEGSLRPDPFWHQYCRLLIRRPASPGWGEESKIGIAYFVSLFLVSASDARPIAETEIERRLSILPASAEEKKKIKSELTGQSESASLTKTEFQVLRSLVEILRVNHAGILRASVFSEDWGPSLIANEAKLNNFKEHLNAYAWLSVLEVYRSLKPSPDYQAIDIRSQRANFIVFAKRRLMNLTRSRPDSWANRGIAKYFLNQFEWQLEKFRLSHGREPKQREVEAILHRTYFAPFGRTKEKIRLPKNLAHRFSQQWQEPKLRSLQTSDALDDRSSTETLENFDENRKLRNHLAAKIDPERLELLHSLERGLSYADIALQLNIDIGTVKSRVFRLRELCVKALADLK